jgi:hypothetical protein
VEDDYHYDDEQDYLEETGEEEGEEEQHKDSHPDQAADTADMPGQHIGSNRVAEAEAENQEVSSSAGTSDGPVHASDVSADAKQLQEHQQQPTPSLNSVAGAPSVAPAAGSSKQGAPTSQAQLEQQALWLLHDDCIQVSNTAGVQKYQFMMRRMSQAKAGASCVVWLMCR